MDMKIVEETGQLTHVALSGELDAAGANEISTKFIGYVTARCKPTIVDIADVSFIASVGMGMLANLSRELKDNQAALVLLNPQQAVEEALNEMSWQKIMPIVHSKDEAFSALDAQQ
jgi:anti-anti-sigma factor